MGKRSVSSDVQIGEGVYKYLKINILRPHIHDKNGHFTRVQARAHPRHGKSGKDGILYARFAYAKVKVQPNPPN